MRPSPPRPSLVDPDCGRTPSEIAQYQMVNTRMTMTPENYVWMYEPTVNRENGHFLCDDCYVARGLPVKSGSALGGLRWICP